MKIIRLAYNAVNAKLIEPPKKVRLLVSELLSYAVEGAEYMTKRPGWDGRSSFFSFKNDSFPAGFVHRVQRKLISEGYMVQMIKRDRPSCRGEINPKVDHFLEDPRYSYQIETVRKLEKFGMMCAQVATGGGKSRIGRLAYKRVNRKTLFLTTRTALMHQFADDCRVSFGDSEVGLVGEGIWQDDRPLVCGMVQTLAARLQNFSIDELIEKNLLIQIEKEKKELDALKSRQAKLKMAPGVRIKEIAELIRRQSETRPSDEAIEKLITKRFNLQNIQRLQTIELLIQFEFVIAEEAHEAGSNSYFDIMNVCKNAYYRLALTATPFMKDDAESNMRLMAVTGGVGIKVSEKKLIDLGILATPIFNIVKTKKPPNMARSTSYQRAYRVGIVQHEWRNRRIVAECVRMARYGLSTMVLIQRVAHGNIIKELLQKIRIKVVFLNGSNDSDSRKKALKKLATGEITVLIGTNILDVGVDVPSVGCIVLGGGGKAEVANRQRIGRGLRAKKIGPNYCFILDFMDEHNKTLQLHALQRRAIINETPGFAANLLPMGKDWQLEDYGFKRIN